MEESIMEEIGNGGIDSTRSINQTSIDNGRKKI